MATTDLKEPVPRKRYTPTSAQVPLLGVIELKPYRSRRNAPSYVLLLSRRRTVRIFRRPSERVLSDLLWLTQGVSSLSSREHGPLPSPGGLHSVKIVVLHYPEHPKDAFMYLPDQHTLGLVATGLAVQAALRSFSAVVPVGGGSFLWFLGDKGRLESKYHNPESLMWKEAGVLTAGVYLAAANLGLNCCAVGRNGGRELKQLGSPLKQFTALGGCIVGVT
jgi:nitroreductase